MPGEERRMFVSRASPDDRCVTCEVTVNRKYYFGLEQEAGRQTENESRSQSCSVLLFFSRTFILFFSIFSICYAQPAWYPNVPSECDKNINLTWPGETNCRPSSCRQHTVFVYIYIWLSPPFSLLVFYRVSYLFIWLVSH